MRIRPLSFCACGTIMLTILFTSCARLPFGGERSETTDATIDTEPVATSDSGSVDDDEDALRRIVANSVERANAGHDAARAELVKKSPYFFKQYEYYPDGASLMEIETRETESRTAPKVADVHLRKQRYVTQLHRKRDEARADEDFLRDTGDEILTYELRNGKWRRVSSLFVAESVEQNVNGSWVPVEEIERTDDAGAEEDLGWFGRIWSSVVGR